MPGTMNWHPETVSQMSISLSLSPALTALADICRRHTKQFKRFIDFGLENKSFALNLKLELNFFFRSPHIQSCWSAKVAIYIEQLKSSQKGQAFVNTHTQNTHLTEMNSEWNFAVGIITPKSMLREKQCSHRLKYWVYHTHTDIQCDSTFEAPSTISICVSYRKPQSSRRAITLTMCTAWDQMKLTHCVSNRANRLLSNKNVSVLVTHKHTHIQKSFPAIKLIGNCAYLEPINSW